MRAATRHSRITFGGVGTNGTGRRTCRVALRGPLPATVAATQAMAKVGTSARVRGKPVMFEDTREEASEVPAKPEFDRRRLRALLALLRSGWQATGDSPGPVCRKVTRRLEAPLHGQP